jgi:hypothetical protein
MLLHPHERTLGSYGPSARTMASITSGGRLSMENRNMAAEAATRRGSQRERSRLERISLRYRYN